MERINKRGGGNFRWQLERCAMENIIKEFRHGLSLYKFPSKKYHANWAYLLIGQSTFSLVV